MKADPTATRAARALGLCGVALWGGYVAAMVRTSGWGYDQPGRELLASLGVFAMFALPAAFLTLIGLPWKRKGILLALLTCACVLGVEAFGRSQEYLLIRKLGPSPQERYTENRWWPFGHHSLGWADGRWWGCD